MIYITIKHRNGKVKDIKSHRYNLHIDLLWNYYRKLLALNHYKVNINIEDLPLIDKGFIRENRKISNF